MRPSALLARRAFAFVSLHAIALLAPVGCQRAASEKLAPAPAPSLAASAELLLPTPPAPISSEGIAYAKSVQASKLQPVPEQLRERRIALGAGVLGQLVESELRVFGAGDLGRVASLPLEGARVLVTLADGGLLAVGSRVALRYDPATKKATTSARPVLLPGAELLPDAIQAERVWVFDAWHGATAPPKLSRFELTASETSILLPEQTLDLSSAAGVLGSTREGVWLYLAGRQIERFGPGGARLSALALPELPRLLWALPSRRLDQCYLLDASGKITRALVTPSFKQLGSAQLSGVPLSADVGDEGRLLAAIVMTGVGPRFELELFDAELTRTAKVELASDAPTGAEDWVKVVTRNQGLAVAAHEPRVAVGGPDRLAIFDARGTRLLSIPSQ